MLDELGRWLDSFDLLGSPEIGLPGKSMNQEVRSAPPPSENGISRHAGPIVRWKVGLTTRFLHWLWHGFRFCRRVIGRLIGRPWWGHWDGEAWRKVGHRLFGHRTALALDGDGHWLRVRPAQWVDLTSLIGRPEEAGVEGVIKSLPVGGTFIDAGAHIGRYTLMAAKRVGPTGRVLAVEPSSENFALLREQASLNNMSWFTPVQLALGHVDTTAVLVRGSDHATGTLHPDWLDNLEGADSVDLRSSQTVKVRSLPSLLAEANLNRVDLLKVDVEGAELDVLKGAEEILRQGQIRQIICEVHEPTVTVPDMTCFLQRCGFTVQDVGSGELHGVWSRPRPISKAPPFRLAIVGCGAITEMAHLPAANQLDGVRLVGLVDTDLAQAQSLASKHGVERAARALDELIGHVDGVVLATPPHVRCKLALHALAQGLHVLCEKPMANSAEECRQMIAQARDSRRTLVVAHTYRFFPNRDYARALFLAGRFGRLISAKVEQGDPYSWPTRTAYTLRKEWVPGGVLFNEGVHILDMLLWWFGTPEGIEYYDDSLGGLESNVRLTLRYSKGAEIHYRLSRTCSLTNRVELKFEKAALSFPIYNMSDIDLIGEEGEPTRLTFHPIPWEFEKVATAQLRDFVRAATESRPSRIPAEAGLAVVDLIESSYRSKVNRPRPQATPLPGLTW